MATLQDVLVLARRGVPVFPLRPGTKDGYLNDASDHGATTEGTVIWDTFRNDNLNFGCWTAGGHVIIDIDADKGGLEAWSALVAEIGPIQPTFTVRSGRGGLHLYFTVDDRGELFSSADLVPGKINVRGVNGYVVGPGSTFTDPATGITGVYTIAVDVPIEPLPDNLRQRLRRRREDKQAGQIVSDLDTPDAVARARARLSWARPAKQGESGDQTTYELACALLDFGITNDTAHALMLELWNPRCVPPWDADELKVKVDNAWTYRQSAIGRDHPSAGFYPMPPHLLRALNTPPAAPEPDTSSPWENPDMSVLRLNRAAPPKLPLQCFGALTDWIMEQAEAKGAPADYVAAGVLGACAALIGSSRRALVSEGWSEPSILWKALVGAPSTNKSPALDAVLEPLARIERDMMSGFASVLRDYEGRRLAAKARREKWEGDVRSAATAGRPQPPMPVDAEEPPKPTRPRVRVSDATVEALARELAQGHRLLSCRDELAGWLGNLDRYGGKGGDRAFFLEAYGGRSYVVDRVKNDEPLQIKFMNLPIVGGIQPDKLDSMLLNSEDDGLTARFLMYWPHPAPLTRSRVRPNNAIIERVFQRLRTLQLTSDGESVEVPFSAPAGEAFWAWQLQHHRVAEPEGIEASALGKNKGHVVRIALVLEHIQWAAGNCSTPPAQIGLVALTRAVQLIEEYFKPMAVRVLGGATVHKSDRAATALARAIVERRATEINLRDVRRRWGLPRLNEGDLLSSACRELQDAGWLRELKNAGPGRPSKTYVVNPIVHEHSRPPN
jgi:hypothetical protein